MSSPAAIEEVPVNKHRSAGGRSKEPRLLALDRFLDHFHVSLRLAYQCFF